MRTKSSILAVVTLVVLVGMLVFASAAFGADQTRIFYGWADNDIYSFTPTTTGTLTVSLSWTGPGGDPAAPVFPQFEVDGLLFTPDYIDVSPAGLYAGTNPQVDTYTVAAGQVNQTWWAGVSPYVGDCPYTLSVKLNGTEVTGFPKTGDACSLDGEINLPNQGTLRQTFQYFPGTLKRTATTASDAWGSWDHYTQPRDGGKLIIDDATTQYVINGPNAAPGGGAATTDIQTYSLLSKDVPAWYNINEELWGTIYNSGSGTVRNTWTDILNDDYPMPGGQTDDRMLMEATYSFPIDAQTNPRANYQWGVSRNVLASERAYSGDASTAGIISASFYGSTVSWVYRRGPQGGNADVYIDGTAPGNKVADVSCYNASALWQQTWNSASLTAGAHTIYIMNDGGAGAGGGYFVYHDRFIAPHDLVEYTNTGGAYRYCRSFENNMDGMTLYKWGRTNNASAHGSYYMGDASTAALTAFTFDGASIDFLYRRGSQGGGARVYIDGVDKGTVNMYNATAQYWADPTSPAITSYSGLGTGLHTIMVANSGAAGAGGGYFVYIDAFRYPSGTGTYYEEWDYTW